MANRRASWRRTPASAQPHHRRPQKNQTALPFSGVEDHALLTLLTHLLSKKVNVNAVNGAVYSGLFAGTQHSPNSNDLLLTLRYARLVRGKPVPSATVHDLRGNTAARIHIPFSRVTTVLGAPFENTNAKRGFATDSQISRGSAGVGRQLQRFEDFTNVQSSSQASDATLDQQTFGSLASNTPADRWDQFQVNKTKFGVTTSFDETEYTTTIDRNSKDFAERQREAARLAEEIESAPSQNVHVREERNQKIGTDDEEARFSGVHRPQSAAQQPSRIPTPTKNPQSVPERPRLSYAAAAASAPSGDPRQHALSKPPSAGATHVSASVNKSTPQSKSTPSQAKNATTLSKPTATAAAKHAQQGGKASQDQTAKHNQSTSKASHSADQTAKHIQSTSRAANSASAKNAPPNGKASSSQAPKSGNKKGTVATNKPQQQQSKVVSSNNKASNQASSNKSASQPANSKSSIQPVSTKSSASAGHAKTPPASTRTSVSSQTVTAAQEQPQTKSTSPKTTTPASGSGKDKTSDDKPKPAVKERVSRDNLPQIIKARAALTGRTSPNQSRNSPLPTPAVADTSAIGVLNLDAQTPNLGPEQIKRFEAFKTKREFQSIAANREKITDALKKFSTQLDSKNGTLRRGQNSESSTPGTPRATSRAVKGVPENNTTERASEDTSKKDVDVVKDNIQKEDPRPEIESKGAKEPETKPVDKPEESAPKPRPKSKSKLNPNAQEFKLNPDAPSFTPASQKTQTQSSTPYVPYSQPVAHVEYSQPFQVPPGYAMPIQTMPSMPYGPPSYVVMNSPVAGGNGSVYPFVQQPASFGPAHVGGRFPQSAGMAVSYPYPHVAPMVIAQPPQQRVPNSPYYHNPGPYAGGQAVPSHMTAPHQAHIYQQGALPHMQGGNLPTTGRGGHGNPRRGASKSRGKTSLQQSYQPIPGAPSGDRPTTKSPEGPRSPGGTRL